MKDLVVEKIIGHLEYVYHVQITQTKESIMPLSIADCYFLEEAQAISYLERTLHMVDNGGRRRDDTTRVMFRDITPQLIVQRITDEIRNSSNNYSIVKSYKLMVDKYLNIHSSFPKTYEQDVILFIKISKNLLGEQPAYPIKLMFQFSYP